MKRRYLLVEVVEVEGVVVVVAARGPPDFIY